MTDKQGRTAGYRLSVRGLLYRDETGRERLAVVYWLTKLGTKTKWVLSLGVVGFIGLVILSAALDSAKDEEAGPPASEAVVTDTTEVQEQDEITKQIAALYPEAYPDWVQCAGMMYDEGDELVDQETVEICGQPEAWKSFVPLAAEQFPQEPSTWIDCAAYNVFSTLTEAELQSYNEEDEFKAQVQMTAHLVCDPPVDPLQAVQELKALLHDALSSVREGCRATSIGDSVIPNSCRPTLDTTVADLKAETEEGLPGVCLDLIKQRFYVIRTLEELGSVVDAATLGIPKALIFLGITLYSEDTDEGGFAALDARITEIDC